MRINSDYILFAHEPAAEDQVPEAMILCKRADQGKMVTIEDHEIALLAELLSCAYLYERKDDNDCLPKYNRTAKRIVKLLCKTQ